jgi:hypothetical protein
LPAHRSQALGLSLGQVGPLARVGRDVVLPPTSGQLSEKKLAPVVAGKDGQFSQLHLC